MNVFFSKPTFQYNLQNNSLTNHLINIMDPILVTEILILEPLLFVFLIFLLSESHSVGIVKNDTKIRFWYIVKKQGKI